MLVYDPHIYNYYILFVKYLSTIFLGGSCAESVPPMAIVCYQAYKISLICLVALQFGDGDDVWVIGVGWWVGASLFPQTRARIIRH